jgi:5-methylcytosine-specific restriction endonuclease McrA
MNTNKPREQADWKAQPFIYKQKIKKKIKLKRLRRDVDVICGLLGNYTASCGITRRRVITQKTTDFKLKRV